MDPQAVGRYPALARYRLQGRWRFPIPPVLGTVTAVERGVREHGARVWVGWHARK